MHRLCFQSLCASAVLSRHARRAWQRPIAWGRWLIIFSAVVALGYRAPAAQPVQARTTSPSPPAAQPPAPPPTDEFVLIKSVFDDDPKSGKDPFFPNSARMAPRETTNAVVAVLPDLVLKGISVTPNKRLAMINSSTLELGEEAEIKVGGKIYKIRCVEIRDRSVVINYKGLTKELALRQGY